MSKTQELKSFINICDTHVLRINYAMQHVKHLIPIMPNFFDELTGSDISFLDQIIKRFSSLQDAIGNKVFPLILELLEEDVPNATFIDKLNKLEKIGALESAEFWKKIRDLRNKLAHEYPEERAYMVGVLNECLEESIKLIEYWDFLKKFIEKKGLIDDSVIV